MPLHAEDVRAGDVAAARTQLFGEAFGETRTERIDVVDVDKLGGIQFTIGSGEVVEMDEWSAVWIQPPAPPKSGPKYPHVHAQLTGEDGNAFAIIGRVRGALARAGVAAAEVRQFTEEATSGDYDHVLQTCMRWVDVS